MNTQTKCPKCQQIYSQTNPPKNLINCTHLICLACLNQEILCPIDRKRIERRRYKIQSFETNQQILQAAEKQSQFVGEQKKQSDKLVISPQINKNICEQNIKFESIEGKELEIQVQKMIIDEVDTGSNRKQKQGQVKAEQIVFQTCLLHSKCADLICLKDKCLICSNCGLFGEHKNHQLLAYDTFISDYTTILEKSYSNFQILKKCEQQIKMDAIKMTIDALIKQKRQNEIKNIRKSVASLMVTIKSIQKTLINQIDTILAEKKFEIIKDISLTKLQKKIEDYYMEVEQLGLGSADIFKLQNIEKYIDYVDENSQKSYMSREGQYLIAEVQTYAKTLRKQINDNINDFQCQCKQNLNDLIMNSFQLVDKNKKDTETTRNKECHKLQVVSESPVVIKNGRDDDLLINSRSNGAGKKCVRDMSPIQPIPKFQETFDHKFKHSYKQSIITQAKQQMFLKVNQVATSQLYIPQHKKTVSFGNNKTINNFNFKQQQSKRQVENMFLNNKIPKNISNNSSHIVEREILSVLNENKKRKKIDIPQKYMKCYDDLLKDKIDVLDFGGAQLGDSTLLSISQIFPNRPKLKSLKLMNNKITDDAFAELVNRCLHIGSINLSYNSLTQKSLQWLQRQSDNLGNLVNITLSNNKIILRNVKDRIQNLKKKGIKVSL